MNPILNALLRARAVTITVGACFALMGCESTPKHTNTMIFGTSTRLALDVSQDPTGSVGITLGYKRLEAVWMPLMPNQAATAPTTGAVPAACAASADCPKFEGLKGSDRDTYSVLATFGGAVEAGADGKALNSKAGTRIAQFFATGFAARSLADRGGAALVNTSADPIGLSPAEISRAELERQTVNADLDDLMARVITADGKALDSAKLKASFAKAPGSTVASTTQSTLLDSKTPDTLRGRLLLYPSDRALDPMLTTLKATAPQ